MVIVINLFVCVINIRKFEEKIYMYIYFVLLYYEREKGGGGIFIIYFFRCYSIIFGIIKFCF